MDHLHEHRSEERGLKRGSGGAVRPMEAPKGRRRESSSGEPPSVETLRGARPVKVTRGTLCLSEAPRGRRQELRSGGPSSWVCSEEHPRGVGPPEPGRMQEERVFRGLSLIRNPYIQPAGVSR